MKSFTTVSAIAAAAASLAGLAQACSTVANNEVTFYGYPDNSPPSAQVAHNCGGRNYVAGGSGSYSDPLTFATAPGEYEVCEILYLPLLKKYIRYEDDCEQCESDWKKGQHHIDIWTGSSTKSGGQSQIDCEDELTSGGKYTVVRQPPQGLEVDSSPLFDGSCHKNNVFESNKASCSAATNGSSAASAAPSSAAPSSSAAPAEHKGKHASTSSAAASAATGSSNNNNSNSCSSDDE